MGFSLKFAAELPANVRRELESLTGQLNAWIGKRGTWQDIAYDAAMFSAQPGMTWTVGPECITTLAAKLDGDEMRLWIELSSTSVGGTLGTDLYLLIPFGKVAAKTTRQMCRVIDSPNYALGCVVSVANSRYLIVRRLDAAYVDANWGATSKGTYVEAIVDIPLVKG